MPKIIINADDFGCNNIITNSIEQLMLNGFVSSTTIMANGSDYKRAVEFARCHEEFSFGAHLCLSEYSSITKDPILKRHGIIENDGQFIKCSIFRKRFFDEKLLCAIKKELSAQMDLLAGLGLKISHIDSHHHVHTIYPLKEVFVEIAKKYGVSRIRRGTEFDNIRSKLHVIKYIKRRQLNSYYSSNLKTVDVFMPYSEIYEKINALNFSTISHIELMCHPGHIGADCFEKEIERLVSDPITIRMGWPLISYNEL